MTARRKIGLGCTAAAALALMTYAMLGQAPGDVRAQSGKTPAVQSADKDDHAVDRAAIAKAVQSFVDAFERKDAKALAAHWTENGEYVADDGHTYRGRSAIEKEYAGLFAKNKEAVKVDIEVATLRFPSKDTAIEEGYFKLREGKAPSSTSKYTVLHVREDGKWLMAVVREWPSEGASLRDLEWLIGAWEAKRGEGVVSTTYEWWGDKTFIKGQLTIKSKQGTSNGFQMIGRDAATGQLRSWIFDADGSFAEAHWMRDGKKWMIESAAVSERGEVVAATNILTPLDHDAFTFQSVHRSVNGEELPDVPPVRVNRTKK